MASDSVAKEVNRSGIISGLSSNEGRDFDHVADRFRPAVVGDFLEEKKNHVSFGGDPNSLQWLWRREPAVHGSSCAPLRE